MRKFTGISADCFHNSDDGQQVAGVRAFTWWTLSNPQVDCYWPNYDAAPWHIQCVVDMHGDEVELNFWPHKSKGQFKYEKAIEPLSAFFEELSKRMTDVEDDIDVLE
jgi:hypothetical protein